MGERQSTGGEEKEQSRAAVNAETLPVEILHSIFEILTVEKTTAELKNCAVTCKRWASISLPLLYRHFGFGVFEYLPPQPVDWERSTSSVIPYSDSPFFSRRPSKANPKVILRQACYWRTLLLSCFWEEDQSDHNVTLYPYIQYVENLDFVVLVDVVLPGHTVRDSLFGTGTKTEGFMIRQFGGSKQLDFILLSTAFNVVFPKVTHLKSANILPEKICQFITINQPVLELASYLSRLINLEICGQDNITPALGAALKALRPSLINAENKTINKNHTFTLRITGPSLFMTHPIQYLLNKRFFDALNPHSVTSIDIDISDLWQWTLETISEFMLSQARTLKSIRLRGVGDTEGVWQLLDKMRQRGCHLRGLDIEDRHVQQPPATMPSAWAFRSDLFKKLKYLVVEGFHGIFFDYHMVDPTSFSTLLEHNLFGGRNGSTPSIKTLILTRTMSKSQVSEQIDIFLMHLAPTLTTLELEYYDCGVLDDLAQGAQFREHGRYKLIEVLLKLSQLRRLKLVGYSANIVLSSCIPPVTEGEELADESPHLRSPSPSPHPHQSPLDQHTIASGFQRSPAFNLFTTTWKSTLEELEIIPWQLQASCVEVCLVDDTLLLFTLLEKLRTLIISFRKYDRFDRSGVDIDPMDGAGAEPPPTFGRLTSRGILRFVNTLPNMTLLQEKMVMHSFSLSGDYVDDNTHLREAWPQWAVEVAESMENRGGKFVLM